MKWTGRNDADRPARPLNRARNARIWCTFAAAFTVAATI